MERSRNARTQCRNTVEMRTEKSAGANLIYFTAVRLLSTHLVSSAILSYGIYFFISANVLIGRGVVGLEYNIFHVCSAAFRTPGFFGILVFCKLIFLFWQVFLSGVVLWGWRIIYYIAVRLLSTHLASLAVLSPRTYFLFRWVFLSGVGWRGWNMVYFMAVRLLSTRLVSLAVLHFCKCCTWRDAKQKRPRLVNTVMGGYGMLNKKDHGHYSVVMGVPLNANGLSRNLRNLKSLWCRQIFLESRETREY